jgi:serine/threonine-protein kinase
LNDLQRITWLKLLKTPPDDLFVFRGFPKLQEIDLTQAQINWEQIVELNHILPSCKIRLRNDPLTVSEQAAQKVFGLDDAWRPLAYIQNHYEDRDEVVYDHATGLTWQKSGSSKMLMYTEAEEYIQQLNRQNFAGYSNWRLPTIAELMSLLEMKEQTNGLYINPVFDRNRTWCWSIDKLFSETVWYAHFSSGIVNRYHLYFTRDVRGVRS